MKSIDEENESGDSLTGIITEKHLKNRLDLAKRFPYKNKEDLLNRMRLTLYTSKINYAFSKTKSRNDLCKPDNFSNNSLSLARK